MPQNNSLNYDFLVPPKIVFGWGRFEEVGSLVRSLGRRAFIVWGSRSVQASSGQRLNELLHAAGVEPIELDRIDHEPEVTDVDRSVERLRSIGTRTDDLVLAIGGGSAIDLAKAVAALVAGPPDATVQDYLEGVGRGLRIEDPVLPVMAVPTTSGTGSEATKNAVISSYDPPFKKSLRCEHMVPRVVLVDPQLTVSLPASITAHSGMDAITQLIESYISRRARPLPQALAIAALPSALTAVVTAVRNGNNRLAREAMAHAAFVSGIALANSGLGLAHGVAAALGVHCRTAHGLACAVMLPVALRVNRPVCERQYAELARAVGSSATSDAAAADAFVERIAGLCHELAIPRRLSELGVTAEMIPALAKSSRGNSMDGNPRVLSDAELTSLLEEIL